MKWTLLSFSHPAWQPFRQKEVSSLALFFSVLYFVQGLADLSVGLASQPLQYLLKEQMDLTAGESGRFWAIIGIGWTIKPLYGLLSDFLPLAGYHRKSYLVLMSTLGMGSWLALAFSSGHYYPVLLLVMACASTLAFCDVMADALMVETGRPLGLTGSFQAMQWASISLAFAVAQLGGGYLAARAAPHTVFLLSACFPLATLLATLLAVRDPKTKINSADLHDTSNALRATVRSPTLWVVVGFLFLWNFSPSLGTPLLYYQVDVLGFSKVFIGTLGALSNVAGMGGALVFLLYYRAIRLDRLLYLTVTLGVASTLGFIGLIGPKSAVVIFVAFGAISQVTHLAVLDLAARSCPPHAEGTVFALLMSTLNLGRMASTACGGWLYEQVGFSWLVVVSAGFTAMCWLIVPYLYTEPGGVVDQ